jgi:hypothetical protein
VRINEHAPTRAMRPDGRSFPMAFDSPPMFAQARPCSAFRFDKLRNCRLFDYLKAIRRAGAAFLNFPLNFNQYDTQTDSKTSAECPASPNDCRTRKNKNRPQLR